MQGLYYECDMCGVRDEGVLQRHVHDIITLEIWTTETDSRKLSRDLCKDCRKKVLNFIDTNGGKSCQS